jgi:hypothetical protein
MFGAVNVPFTIILFQSFKRLNELLEQNCGYKLCYIVSYASRSLQLTLKKSLRTQMMTYLGGGGSNLSSGISCIG